MSIQLSSESLLSPTQARNHVPGRPHVATIWRWMTKGSRGVRLESIVCGGRRFTSVEAIQRFVARTTAAAGGSNSVPSSVKDQQAIQEAEKQLQRDGFNASNPTQDLFGQSSPD